MYENRMFLTHLVICIHWCRSELDGKLPIPAGSARQSPGLSDLARAPIAPSTAVPPARRPT